LKRDTKLSAASSSSSSSSTWAKWSMIRQAKMGIALILGTERTPDPHWHGPSLAMTPMTTQQPACCCISSHICRLHRCCCIWPQLYELIDLEQGSLDWKGAHLCLSTPKRCCAAHRRHGCWGPPTPLHMLHRWHLCSAKRDSLWDLWSPAVEVTQRGK
jgi:hypothetical protein